AAGCVVVAAGVLGPAGGAVVRVVVHDPTVRRTNDACCLHRFDSPRLTAQATHTKRRTTHDRRNRAMSTTTRRTGTLVPPAEETRYEDELARGLRAADGNAVAALYRRWGPLGHALAVRALGDRPEAGDVARRGVPGAWR